MPPIPNHEDTVALWRRIYDDLPPGNERAFRIANATAWTHKEEGAGILHKPSGNNFQGYATDIVVYPDGRHYDVLVGGAEEARPTWRLITNPPRVDPARWRPPLDPQLEEPGEPPPPPRPPGNQHCWAHSDGLFAETLSLMQQCAAKWRGLHVPPGTPNGHLLLDEGQVHIWLYRYFVQGWSVEQILADVK